MMDPRIGETAGFKPMGCQAKVFGLKGQLWVQSTNTGHQEKELTRGGLLLAEMSSRVKYGGLLMSTDQLHLGMWQNRVGPIKCLVSFSFPM